MRQFSILCSIFVLIFSVGNMTVLAETGKFPFLSGYIISDTIQAIHTGSLETGTTNNVSSPKESIKKKGGLRFQFAQTVYTTPLPSRDDASILRFVSKNVALSNQNYEPSDLVRITYSSIDEAGRSSKLRSEAARSLWSMADAFEKKFHTPLVVVSGYRSAAYQKRMWDLGRCNSTLCAPPGYSEHQLGLAVDLFDASTAEEYYKNPKYASYVRWLTDNAYQYGWTQSYQKGVSIDNYEVEPWHWRYVGIDMASRLKDLGWTYTEYIQFNESIRWIR